MIMFPSILTSLKVPIFETTGVLAKICLGLKSNRQIKLNFFGQTHLPNFQRTFLV